MYYSPLDFAVTDGQVNLNILLFLCPLHWMMLGSYSFSVFHMWVSAYKCTSDSVCTNVRTYVHDPVKLGLRHLYQVDFCSFIFRCPTAGASIYCGHISSYFYFLSDFFFL